MIINDKEVEDMVKVAIIGYGNRGRLYARFMKTHPEIFQVVGIVDTLKEKLEIAEHDFHLNKDALFTSADTFFASDKKVDLLIIASMDKYHYHQAIQALNKGMHILLEKPISTSIHECLEIEKLAAEKNCKVVVAHVLRYTMFYKKIKELLDQKVIGDVQHLTQNENVAYWHFAHSFVRGNWANEQKTGPMILTKCCHDLDMIAWLMNQKVSNVSSFGSLKHIKAENKPENAGMYCNECPVAKNCPFDAYRFYFNNGREWLRAIIGDDLSDEHISQFLQHNQYARCVYRCENNVVDHQSVNILFANQATATLTMNAYSCQCYRQIHIFGTMGEIIGDFEKRIIEVKPFLGKEYIIDINQLTDDFSGHGGGDNAMLLDFVAYIEGKDYYQGLTTIQDSVLSHILAFAAEKSRCNQGKSIDIAQFMKEKI